MKSIILVLLFNIAFILAENYNSPVLTYNVASNFTQVQTVMIPRISNTNGMLSLQITEKTSKNPTHVWVCANLNFSPTSYASFWSQSSCDIFAETTTTGTINLPNARVNQDGMYMVRVASNDTVTLKFMFTASYCSNWVVGTNCGDAGNMIPLVAFKTAVPVSSKGASGSNFRVQTVPLTNYAYVQVVLNTTTPRTLPRLASNMTHVYVQVGNIPDTTMARGYVLDIPFNQTSSVSTINAPPGNTTIVVSVPHSQPGSDFTVTLNPVTCQSGQYGPTCSSMFSSFNITDVTLMQNTSTAANWWYGKFDIVTPLEMSFNTTTPFFFGVAPMVNGTASPKIYLRKGDVPTSEIYDLAGNNVAGTGGSVLAAQSLSAGTWFVGIDIPVNASFVTWAGSLCPGNCSGVGTCQATGTGFGTCDCSGSGYEGVGCQSESGGFKTEYIVLIVIAGVIIVAGVLGFIVFLLNSRERSIETIG